jgi:Domain of unknown function (DUF4328)
VSADVVAPAQARRAYGPLRGRARTAKQALALVIAVDVISVLIGGSHYGLLDQAQTGGVTDVQLQRSDLRIAFVSIAQVLVLIAAAVLFLRWFYRAYSNLEPLGATALRSRRGWAIGIWFVPILNLWRPKQLADDIWRASDPGRPIQQGGGWRDAKVPALLGWWWGFYLLTWLVANYALRSEGGVADIEQEMTATGAYLVSDVTAIVAALLAIKVVTRLTERQEARASKVRAAQLLTS